MSEVLKLFWRDESGATAIEYGLLTALLAVALIGSMDGLGQALDGSLTNTANAIP